MSSVPVHSPPPPDDSSVVDHALVGALAYSSMGGLGVGLASAFLGAVGSHFARQYGVGAAFGGSAGVAISCLVLPLVFMEHLTLRSTLTCLLAGGITAATVNWWIGPRFEWKFFRWALAGAAIGTFGGAVCGPIFLAKGGKMPQAGRLHRGKEALFLTLAHGLAAIIKWVNHAAAGAVLAGGIGGALGSLVPSSLAAKVGGQADLEELLGSTAGLLLCGVTLGVVGGVWGGLQAWRLRDKYQQLCSPESEAKVSADPSAPADGPRE